MYYSRETILLHSMRTVKVQNNVNYCSNNVAVVFQPHFFCPPFFVVLLMQKQRLCGLRIGKKKKLLLGHLAVSNHSSELSTVNAAMHLHRAGLVMELMVLPGSFALKKSENKNNGGEAEQVRAFGNRCCSKELFL